ncbi:MAG TPA: dockerin type I domain-containing protein [Phycisphaerae bacterium]|nr:dockerin type I domain-containing protein [Phycisphaerae bacterium]
MNKRRSYLEVDTHRKSISQRAFIIGVIVFVFSDALQAECPPPWSDQFGFSIVSGGEVRAMAVFDEDGTGPLPPMLFAGGSFTNMGGVSASGIARWDGRKWSPVGGGISVTLFQAVYCLKVYDEDGEGPGRAKLVVGGGFLSAGGTNIKYLAQWDGESWAPLGNGPEGFVYALEIFDDDGDGPNKPALFVGGSFTVVDGEPTLRVAKYFAGNWESLGGGVGDTVRALATHDEDGDGPVPPRLFAGGSFHMAGSVPATKIARWDGTAWSAVGSGLTSWVYCLTVHDDDGVGPHRPELYAGGEFNSGSLSHIAKWNGTAWSGVGTGTSGRVNAMLSFDADGVGPDPATLYVTGSFSDAGGLNAWHVAEWDGLNWLSIGSPSRLREGFAWAEFKDPYCHSELRPYLGGSFTQDQYNFGPVARLNGPTWEPLRASMNEFVKSLITLDADGDGPAPPSLYAAGRFSLAGSEPGQVARWDGRCWEGMPGPFSTIWINAMAGFDEDGPGPAPTSLFVGDPTILARWDGNTWSTVDNTITGVTALCVFDDDANGPNREALYIACFSSSLRFAKWDGDSLTSVSHVSPEIDALCVFDEDGSGPLRPALFVGGDFSVYQEGPDEDGDGEPDLEYFRCFAKWDGTRWSALGAAPTGSSPHIRAMIVFDPDGIGPTVQRLIVAGQFTGIGGISAANIAQWDGLEWSPLGAGANGEVYALAVFDQDDDGPNPPVLYAGGQFSGAGGRAANRIAKWDGAAWTALGSGLDGLAYAVLPFDDDGDGPIPPALYVGGGFTTAGGLSSGRIARWDPQYEAPAWYEEPLDRSAPVGSRVLFTGSATSGQDLTYRWRKDGVPLSDDARIYGTNTPLLTIQSVSALDEGDYDLETNNECASVISQSAHLTVCENDPNGDVNDDGVIDGRDIRVFVQQAFAANPSSAGICAGDADRDGSLDAGDLSYFVSTLLAD